VFTNPISFTQDKKEKKNANKKLSLSFTVQVKSEKETATDEVYSDYFVH